VDCSAYNWTTSETHKPQNPTLNPQIESEEQEEHVHRNYIDDFLVQHPFWRKHVPVTGADLEVFTANNLIFEMERASVHDPSYHALAQTGWAGWFHDEAIGISLDFLERILPCAQHKIALSNIAWATDPFLKGKQKVAIT
jgi:hypothetical protein